MEETPTPMVWPKIHAGGRARAVERRSQTADNCSEPTAPWGAPAARGSRRRRPAAVAPAATVGLTAARARGRNGGRTFAPSKAQVRLAQAAMAHRDTSVSALCRELGITPVTLYRYVGPQGQLREQGEKVLAP